MQKLLYAAQFGMCKKDRIVMGNRLLDTNAKLFAHIAMANNCKEERMKRRNEYRNSVKILSMIDDSWYKFIKKDVDNMKVVAKKAYNHRNLLKYKYNLKFKKI